MAKQVLIFLDFTLPNVCQEVLNLQFLISGCLLYQHAYSPIILYGDHLPPHPLWLLPHFHAEDISNPYPTCIFSKLYGDHSHPDHITFFAEQDIMYYFLISHKIYTLFSSFLLLATNKGDTSLRHWVLVPVSCLFCTTRQNSTIFKRSLHMQGFSGGGRISYWWAQAREGKFHPSLERYSQGRVYNRN